MNSWERIIKEYHVLIDDALSKIPLTTCILPQGNKPEDDSEEYYLKQGYTVIRSKLHSGYRCVDMDDFYLNYPGSFAQEKRIIRLLKLRLGRNYQFFRRLVKPKNGTPDFLLIRGEEIEFVEVKSENEEIKPCTLEFYLKLQAKIPMRILRVFKSNLQHERFEERQKWKQTWKDPMSQEEIT